MPRTYRKHIAAVGAAITQAGERNIESLMRELVRSPDLSPAPSAGAVLTNQANSGPDQEHRISLLESQVDWLKTEHGALVKQIEDLREEMRRMVYRIE